MSGKADHKSDALKMPFTHEGKYPRIDGVLRMCGVTRELLDVFPNLPFKPEDVIVATYPKAGTTWVTEIVWQIQHDAAIATTMINHRVPFMECLSPKIGGPSTKENVLKLVETFPSPRVFKMHIIYDLALKGTGRANCPKYVSIMRNPKDTAVSFFHFYRGLAGMGFDGSWDEFFEMFITGEVVFGSWFDHVLGWWQQRDDPNILMLKFEDMKKDLPRAIRKLALFTGRDISDDMVLRIASQTSFDAMEGKQQFKLQDAMKESHSNLRKGEVGDWKNLFTEEQNRRMDEMIKKNLSGTGLEFEYE